MKKGFSKNWIEQRLFGINARNKLTDEWKDRGINEKKDYALLTNEICYETFGFTTKQIKEIKHIPISGNLNLRDHMDDMELAFTYLSEITSRELHIKNDSQGKENLSKDIKEAGAITSKTRKEIEQKLDKKVIKN